MWALVCVTPFTVMVLFGLNCDVTTSLLLSQVSKGIGNAAPSYFFILSDEITSFTVMVVDVELELPSCFLSSDCVSSLENTLINATTGNITTINNYAFYYYTSLTSVTIPESVESIGSYAFDYCSKLKELVLPTNSNFTNIKNDMISIFDKAKLFKEECQWKKW